MTTTPAPDDADLIADEIRDVLVTYGWCQDRLVDEQGRHCMMGAYHLVNSGFVGTMAGEPGHRYMTRVMTVIREQYPDRLEPGSPVIPTFNDHAATTLDDVLAVLDKARNL